MQDADVDWVIKTIRDPACLYLCQTLTPGGIDVVNPATDIPSGWEILRSLWEWKCKEDIQQMIISTFNHLSEAHAHASSAAVNISFLGNITDPEMFDMILRAAACPMIQVNIPERYLSPVQDPKPATLVEEQKAKLQAMLLPRHDAACVSRELQNNSTCLLAAVIWLQLRQKYLNEGMAKGNHWSCTQHRRSPMMTMRRWWQRWQWHTPGCERSTSLEDLPCHQLPSHIDAQVPQFYTVVKQTQDQCMALVTLPVHSTEIIIVHHPERPAHSAGHCLHWMSIVLVNHVILRPISDWIDRYSGPTDRILEKTWIPEV